jgi:hypothetical protein
MSAVYNEALRTHEQLHTTNHRRPGCQAEGAMGHDFCSVLRCLQHTTMSAAYYDVCNILRSPEQGQWKTMSAAYYEAPRTHEQWCVLNSTPTKHPVRAGRVQGTSVSPSNECAWTAHFNQAGTSMLWSQHAQDSCATPVTASGFEANMHEIAAPLLPQRLVLEPTCTR